MKKYIIENYKIIGILILLAFLSAAIFHNDGTGSTKNSKTYDELFVCSMHPWEALEGPGACPICGMELSEVHGHEPGTPLPGESNLFVSESDPMYIHEGAGEYPDDGSALIPITQSPFYEKKVIEKSMADDGHEDSAQMQTKEGTLWTCGMHPEVISDKPGICPICHMDLIPMKNSTASGSGLTEHHPHYGNRAR